MKIPIIKIGNSEGILLSKTILDRYKFENKVNAVMKQNHLELKPIHAPREGWDEKFSQMHQRGDDDLLMDDLFEEDEFEEWK